VKAGGKQSLKSYIVKNVCEFRLDDIVLNSDYAQLVIPEIHVISDNKGDNNGSDEQEEEIINVALRGVSTKFLWQNICSFPVS
jgi:hypothetical protein